MKSYFSFLILLFAFVGLVSSSEEDNSPFRLVQASGILYEKKSSQDIIFIAQGKNINPYFLKQLVLREERLNEIYFARLNCQDKEEIYDYTYVKCKIDLSKIQKGFYKMAVIFYANEDCRNNNLPPLLILGDGKIDDELKLTSVVSNVTEYNKNQRIELTFNKKVDYPYQIRNLFIQNNRSQHYQVPLFCNYRNGTNNTTYQCEGDFSKIGGDIYFIERLEYNYNYTYPSRNITLEVYGQSLDDFKLLYIDGQIQNENTSRLNLTFKGNVVGSEFGKFYLFNRNSSYSYRLYNQMIRQINRTLIEVELEAYNVSAGYYNLGFFYKGNDWRFSDVYVYVKDYSYYPHWNFTSFVLNLFGGQKRQKINLPKKK